MELIEHTPDIPDPSLEAMWAKEAEDRLSAYRRGEISALPLAEVLSKYTTNWTGRA